MSMPPWQDQPADREYKRKLAELRMPLPRWWPGRVNAEVVGGDLDTGSVIVHLPFEGNPYLARVPAEGPAGGNTASALSELDRTLTRYEWIEGDWKYIVFSSDYLSSEDLAHIKLSMRSISLETSSRSAPFDPTDQELFALQTQGFDWQLLQNGFVHRYKDRFSLDTACGHLSDLDYVVHTFDAESWHNVADMHTDFAAAMSFPDYYGRNLDALDDVLSDVGRYSYGSDADSAGTALAIAGYDAFLKLDRRTALVVLDIFARQARLAALYGHAMLCLIESTDSDLGRVGGVDVLSATVSEFPPDPPEPFDESVVIEFSFQFYATDAEADKYAADLRSAVSPILDQVGRYQTRLALASERAGQSDKRHSSSRRERQPGQKLFDISVGVRGRGDRYVLGEQIFHAVTAAKLPFEQMTETPFGGPYVADALARYPALSSATDPTG